MKRLNHSEDSSVWNLTSKYFSAKINLRTIDLPINETLNEDEILASLKNYRTEALIYYVPGVENIKTVSRSLFYF